MTCAWVRVLGTPRNVCPDPEGVHQRPEEDPDSRNEDLWPTLGHWQGRAQRHAVRPNKYVCVVSTYP